MSFARKSFSLISNRIVVTCAGVILSIILARILGPTKLGIIVIIMMVPQYCEKFGRFGLASGAIYRISRNEINIRETSSILLTFSLIIGCFLPIAFYACREIFFNAFLKEHVVASWYFLAILSTLPANFVRNYFTSFFVARENVRTINRLRLLNGILPGTLAILLLSTTSLDVGAVILSTTTINFVAVAYVMNRFKNMTGEYPKLSMNISHFVLLFSYGYKVYIRNIISFVHYRVDLLLIAYYLTSPYVAFYSLAVSFAEKIWILNIGSILFSRVASSDDKYGQNLTISVFRNTFWLMSLLTMFIYFTSDWLVRVLYGNSFMPVVMPLKLLLPGVVMLGACSSLSQYFIGKGQVTVTNYIYGASILLNVVLNIFLIPIYGISGAALSTSITYILSTLVMSIIFINKTDTNLVSMFIITRADLMSYRRVFSHVRQA